MFKGAASTTGAGEWEVRAARAPPLWSGSADTGMSAEPSVVGWVQMMKVALN